MFLVYQTCPPCKHRVIGAIARIAEMTVGIIGGIAGIEEITATDRMVTPTETSRKVFVTDWIGEGKTLVIAGHSIRITPAISEMVTPPIAKGSAEGTRKATAKIITPGDGNY